MSIELSFNEGAAIVAGGTGGIGEAICKRFAQAGAPVVFSYHNNVEKARQLQQEIQNQGGQCHFMPVDLAAADEVDALYQEAASRYGKIAHVVYAAGPSFDFALIGDIPATTWQQVINADINGAFNLIQGAVQQFRLQGGGNLLAVVTSALECVPKADTLSASPKAAIEMLIKGVAKESGKLGIRANCVGPGWINAGLGKKGMEQKLTPDYVEKLRKTAIPMQTFGEADDIAYAALFLCSQQAGFITGQTLAVDGGAQL